MQSVGELITSRIKGDFLLPYPSFPLWGNTLWHPIFCPSCVVSTLFAVFRRDLISASISLALTLTPFCQRAF